jgi:hypothetical protein
MLLTQMTVPIDGNQIEELFRYIIKGLMWYHWKVIFTRIHIANNDMEFTN